MLLRILFFFFLFNSFSFAQSNWTLISEDKISDIVKLIYKDVDQSLHPAAAMSTLAHLKRMESNQEVTVQGKGLEGLYNIA